jgi:uncharacterized protein YyaL (SSP411 family)
MYSQAMREANSTLGGVGNQLESSAASYLRSARYQPVHWQAWSPAAFARAQAEDKPILLDVGAVWCHWCHVMDRESYEDPSIAEIINDNFVAIKVDRDERPDVDARYQAAVLAISGQGGWPLTAFLTPDGRPYFGATYFPREDRYGRPGFGRVLLTMAEVWRERREEALESAASVMAAMEHSESFSGGEGELSLALVDRIVETGLKQFDARHGGFGSQPKFPHPAALDLLLEVGTKRGNDGARVAFETTLERMARGGIYDQLAGGFHRYSVDERWVVPHFEKMLYDNTELLRNYVHGYQSLARQDFLQTAQEIIHWLDESMTDREHGGFFASQDADIDLDDDGDYFTWTLEEARAALDPAEAAIATRYWAIRELGDMQHNPAKNVLHVRQTLEEMAIQSGRPEAELRATIDEARRKLLATRKRRIAPFIDRTLYTGWNAMGVTAYLESARVLRLDSAREFGLRTLTRLLAQAWDGAETLGHVIAYGMSSEETRALPEQAPGTLDDYALTVHACVDAWLASQKMEFYGAALKLADAMIGRFWDAEAGAFNDAASSGAGGEELGALTARRSPVQDTPTPGGNPTAAAALLRLEMLSGRSDYRAVAEKTLQSFSAIVSQFGLYAGSYGLALERLLADPVQVVVVGSGAEADRLEATAMAGFEVGKTVIRIAKQRLTADGIPPALARMLLEVPVPTDAGAWAIVCRNRTCRLPATNAEDLREELEAV